MRNERVILASGGTDMAFATPWTMLEKMLLLAICLFTLAFVIITPPFQAPDENQHYMKALLLSEGGVLTEQHGPMVGAFLPGAALKLHAEDFPTDVSAQFRHFEPEMLQKAWKADASRPGKDFADFPNVANYAPTLYAPGALGLMLGDTLNLPRLGTFYSGRLMNALAGLALLVSALGLLPFGRNALLATALLPTFAAQTGSLSPDAVINGLGFLGLALALRIGFMGSTSKRSLAILLVAPLLALAKGVYLPLLAAGLRWSVSNNRNRFWLLIMAMIFGAAAFIFWMKISGGTQVLYHIVSRKTGESVMTSPLSAQLAVILRDPLSFAHVLITSVTERAPVYILQIVGRFGWNAILLPLIAYPIAVVMLGAGVLSGSGAHFPIAQRLWWLAVATGGAVLIEVAMYLTGTPLAADYIQGTQGRYFLPLLPLVLIALSPTRPFRAVPWIFGASALLLLVIALATAFDSFWVHGFVTSDGMPPHDSLGRALLFPSPRW